MQASSCVRLQVWSESPCIFKSLHIWTCGSIAAQTVGFCTACFENSLRKLLNHTSHIGTRKPTQLTWF